MADKSKALVTHSWRFAALTYEVISERNTMRLSLLGTLALQVGLLLQGIPAAMAQSKTNLTGAIFTTVSDGTAVNANIYASKCSVYLDGGPGAHAPAGAAGLPDGDFYFQVTDPSGKQLLSTDPVSNRRFTVHNGVIIAYTGVGGPVHPVGLDRIHPELHAVTIQAANASCPTDFLDSPNNGGAYKIWATPVSSFLGDATLARISHKTIGKGRPSWDN